MLSDFHPTTLKVVVLRQVIYKNLGNLEIENILNSSLRNYSVKFQQSYNENVLGNEYLSFE